MSTNNKSSRARALRTQDLVQCQWCGRAAEIGTLREIEVHSRKFKVCDKCPSPDNANSMRV